MKKEEEKGLPSLPFMKGSDEMSLAKGEVGFLNFVIMPWYEQMATCFPKLQHLKGRVEANLETWKRIVEHGPSAIPPRGEPETLTEAGAEESDGEMV